MKEWDTFGLDVEVLRGIYSNGFEYPSPIQEQVIPIILTGKDTIAQAQSGTGKTGAFCISALQLCKPIAEQQVLILSPTRELAMQTDSVFKKLSCFTKIKSQLLIGGTSVDNDLQDMRKNPQVIIGCPGRVLDFLSRGNLHGPQLSMVILDEADEILSQGFQQQLQSIFKFISTEAQVVMFSATIPDSLHVITDKIMTDPEKILVKSDMLTLEGIAQYYVSFDSDADKLAALQDLYEGISMSQSIIYCNSVKRVCSLYSAMKDAGYPVCCIHSDMDKKDRHDAYMEFKSGKHRVLISSNVTSRGIDIQQVSIVINFDLPRCVHNYLHRIGRSGRWGRKGLGINFITKYDKDMMTTIETHYHTHIKELPDNYSELIK
jgi:translation initiation factor 4A